MALHKQKTRNDEGMYLKSAIGRRFMNNFLDHHIDNIF